MAETATAVFTLGAGFRVSGFGGFGSWVQGLAGAGSGFRFRFGGLGRCRAQRWPVVLLSYLLGYLPRVFCVCVCRPQALEMIRLSHAGSVLTLSLIPWG